MLYDGAIKFLKQAQAKIQERNYAEKGILISKAIDVISELDGSLNVQKGGDLATNLHNLYFFCNTRLLQANMKMDTKLIDDVIDILSGLREAFAQIADNPASAPSAKPKQGGAKVTPLPQKNGPLPHPSLNMGEAGQTAYTPHKAPAPTQSQAPTQPQTQKNPAPESPQEMQPAAVSTPPLGGLPRPKAKPAPRKQTANAARPGPKNPAGATIHAGPMQTQDIEAPAQNNKSKLLAGSNIYRKMAMQQQE